MMSAQTWSKTMLLHMLLDSFFTNASRFTIVMFVQKPWKAKFWMTIRSCCVIAKLMSRKVRKHHHLEVSMHHLMLSWSTLEDIFYKNFSIYTKSSSVGHDILKLLNEVKLPFKSCDEFPLIYLRKLFLRMRIYYSLKFANRELSCKK